MAGGFLNRSASRSMSRRMRLGRGFEQLEPRVVLDAVSLVADLSPLATILPYASTPVFVGEDAYFVSETAYLDSNGRNRRLMTWQADEEFARPLLTLDNELTQFTPTHLTPLGDRLLFVNSEGGNNALWVTDGSDVGTQSFPVVVQSSKIEATNELAFFIGYSNSSDRGLWATDGTEAGTRLVIPQSESNIKFIAADDRLFFTIPASGGNQLWVSDGSATGTQQVATPSTFPNNAAIHSLTTVGNDLFFAANDQVNGHTLWTSDATAAGTQAIFWSTPTNPSGAIESLTPIDGRLAFVVNGTDVDEVLVTGVVATDFTSLLQVPDETPNGSRLVDQLVAVDDQLFFRVLENQQRTLWKSDIASSQTAELLSAGGSPIVAYELATFDNELLYTAAVDLGHFGIWRTDGTLAGTALIDQFPSSEGSVDLRQSAGSTERFLLTRSYGEFRQAEVWVIQDDQLNPVLTSRGGTDAQVLTALGDQVIFFGDDGVSGFQLFASNGTAAGTIPLQAPGLPLEQRLIPHQTQFVQLGSQLFFNGLTIQNGFELWATDGTVAGTRLVRDSAPGAGDTFVTDEVNLWTDGQRIYFDGAGPGNLRQVWVSDGTETGTKPFREFAAVAYSNPRQHTVVGDRVFFTASDPVNGRNLWVTSAGPAAATRVSDLIPGAGDAVMSELTAVGNTLFFSMYDAANPRSQRLWSSDGTAGGTQPLEAAPSSGATNYRYRLVAGIDRLYFVASNRARSSAPESGNNEELWVSDGTIVGTRMVRDIRVGSAGSQPEQLVTVGNQLYFSASTENETKRLWTSDGTLAGTVLVTPLLANDGQGHNVAEIVAGVDAVYFSAYSTARGQELWWIDPDSGMSEVLSDIQAGLRSSAPRELTRVGRSVFFSAADELHGREIWQVTADDPIINVSDVRYGSPDGRWVSADAVAGRTVAWKVSEIAIKFDHVVSLDKNRLSVVDGKGQTLAIREYRFDAETNTGVWTLDTTVANAKLSITLSARPPLGQPATSGGSTIGQRDTVRVVTVLHGDINGDAKLSLTDFVAMRTDQRFAMWSDLTGDGRVTYVDWFELLFRVLWNRR